MKKSPKEAEGAAPSVQEPKGPSIDPYEGKLFSYVLNPKEALSFMPNECDNLPPEFDWLMEGRGETSESMCEVSKQAVRRLKIMAQKGNSDAIRALVNLTYSTIVFLNSLADGKGGGAKPLKKVASKAAEWPQLIGMHPDVVKESQNRMEKIGLGARLKLKTRASNRPAGAQPFRDIMGGYASRLNEVISMVRDDAIYWRNKELPEKNLIQWIRDALTLPADKSEWCSFALKSLKDMNGGNYPEDFIARGKSNGDAYERNAAVTKSGKGKKSQAVNSAEKAFRKAWKARF